MKIAQLIAKYLQENKTITLEGFGVFTIDEATTNADVSDKHTPSNPVLYEYKPSVSTELPFVDYVVKETGKIRPLAIADLETYISLSKQMLNISKPVVIEGVGTLTKLSAGHYEFVAGMYEPPKINTENERDKKLRQAKEVNRENEIRYNREAKERRSTGNIATKKILGAITLFALVALSAWAVYTFILKKQKQSTAEITTEVKPTSTDTATKPITTPQVSTIATTNTGADSLGRIQYKVIVRVGDSLTAYKRYKQLLDYKEKVTVERNAQGLYKVAILTTSLPQDSIRVKDSLQKIYPTAGQVATIEH